MATLGAPRLGAVSWLFWNLPSDGPRDDRLAVGRIVAAIDLDYWRIAGHYREQLRGWRRRETGDAAIAGVS